MGVISITSPTLGGTNASEEPKVITALQTCIDLVNGNIDGDNTAAAFAIDSMEPAFTTWKTIARGGGTLQPGAVAGTYVLYGGAEGDALNAPTKIGSSPQASACFYLDPADWAADAHTPQVRLAAQFHGTTTAPGGDFTFGLSVPTISFAGLTVSAVAASLTSTTFTAPPAGTHTRQNSTAAALAAAGMYCFTLTTTATIAANSRALAIVELQMQQV